MGVLSFLGVAPERARKVKLPKGLDPESRAHFEALQLQLEDRQAEREFALRVEKVRRRRDILMSFAQATATNPMGMSAAVGLTGAAISTVGAVAREVANKNPALAGKGIKVTDLEIAGKGLMVLGGAKLTAETTAEIIAAIRGAPTSQSIAFDIPDSEGPALLQAQPLAQGYFPVPDSPAPRRSRSPAR